MTGGTLRILGAEVEGSLADVEVVAGVVTGVHPAGRLVRSAETDIDASGGALLPGLHDHHVHLLAMAAALDSVAVDPATVVDTAGFATALRAADRSLGAGEWIRAVGFHESAGGELDRTALDALVPDRPVRVQHRSGALWVLNSAAMRVLGEPPAGADDGRLFRHDGWLRERLDAVTGPRPLPLRRVGATFASFGVTGVTDLTPSTGPGEFRAIAAAVASGELPLRVTVTGSASIADVRVDGVSRGPVKIVVDDHRLPGLDEVIAQVVAARAAGRAVAVHCVTRESLLLAMVALREVGVMAGDRIEHGAVVPVDVFGELAAMGLVVVTQPSFVRERGDQYLLDVDSIDRPDLWRCASLVDAGVGVAFGSDAPYGSADPWAMVRAAVDRTTIGGQVLGVHEALDPAAALERLLGSADQPCSPRRIEIGMPADLCLLDRPLRDALASPSAEVVRTTLVAGLPTPPSSAPVTH